MYDQILFYIVFLSQILLISFFLPRQVLERLRYVVKHYPPESYPRLYPVPLRQVERAQRNYRVMNLLVLGVGLALVGYTAWTPSEELLGWDTKTVVFLYYMLQYSPLMIATTAGFTYFNLKRKPDTRSTRRASLRPRRLFDYLSPMLAGVAALVYVAFIVFIGWMRTFDFPWFGGWANVAGITAMNALFGAIIAYSLYGKRKDPYMSPEDRDRALELNATVLVFISIFATMYVALSIGLSALDLRNLSPMTQSLYFQVISVAAFRSFRIDKVNFDVYREDPVSA
jgi:hypothetical protein